MFQKEPTETSFNLCPGCKSSMVVEKANDSVLNSLDSSAITKKIQDDSSYAHMNGVSRGSSLDSVSSQLSAVAKEDKNRLDQATSSIEVVIPFSNECNKNLSSTPLSRSITPRNEQTVLR